LHRGFSIPIKVYIQKNEKASGHGTGKAAENSNRLSPSVSSNDAELLKPLVPICHPCLGYNHSYVRKNAVFSVYTIYREFENLIPDAPELSKTFGAESDATCKRNAFVFLAHCAMPKAVEQILSIYEQISGLDELLQMSVIKVIRLDFKNDSAHE
jgi:coatomer subunit beta